MKPVMEAKDTIMKKFTRTLIALAAILVMAAIPVAAQTTVTQTTTTAAISQPAQGLPYQTITVTSATGIVAGSELMIDAEAMLVNSVSSLVLTVQRGYDGSKAAAHASGAVVYAGPTSGVTGSPFVNQDPPIGACTYSSELYSLRINTNTGKLWSCLSGTWQNVIDSFMFVGAGNCFGSTTGGTLTTPAAVTNVNVYATTWTGLINSSATAPGTPVLQIATTSAGTATNTVSCSVPLPTRSNPARGVYVADATWVYGLQQTVANATQVAVEASGTMNGIVAFGKIVVPAAGAAETASTVAQARWDTGTMVLTPAKAAFNNAITTTGAFFTQKIAPAAPVAMTTDATAYFVNLTVLHTATSASTLQVAGVLIHYLTVTDY